jgi:hypothetical protein
MLVRVRGERRTTCDRFARDPGLPGAKIARRSGFIEFCPGPSAHGTTQVVAAAGVEIRTVAEDPSSSRKTKPFARLAGAGTREFVGALKLRPCKIGRI